MCQRLCGLAIWAFLLRRQNGTSLTIAVIVVLVYRLFSFWMPNLAGIARVPYLEQRKRG